MGMHPIVNRTFLRNCITFVQNSVYVLPIHAVKNGLNVLFEQLVLQKSSGAQ